MKIAIIGAGNLGLSIAKGLILTDSITHLYLCKRKHNTIKDWEEYSNVSVTSDNRKAVKDSDVLIFSSQPGQLGDILEDIKDLLTNRHVVIVTAAGYKIETIERILGSDFYIIRAMPNTAISIGKSMTCISTNEKGKARIELTKSIFNKLGSTAHIDEDMMQAATVICASGVAFWMRLIRASTQAAIQLGFEAEQALELSSYTCSGASSLLTETNRHPEEEIDRVTTPKGCTIEGLNELEHQGMSSSFIKGIQASYDKISEISKQ